MATHASLSYNFKKALKQRYFRSQMKSESSCTEVVSTSDDNNLYGLLPASTLAEQNIETLREHYLLRKSRAEELSGPNLHANERSSGRELQDTYILPKEYYGNTPGTFSSQDNGFEVTLPLSSQNRGEELLEESTSHKRRCHEPSVHKGSSDFQTGESWSTLILNTEDDDVFTKNVTGESNPEFSVSVKPEFNQFLYRNQELRSDTMEEASQIYSPSYTSTFYKNQGIRKTQCLNSAFPTFPHHFLGYPWQRTCTTGVSSPECSSSGRLDGRNFSTSISLQEFHSNHRASTFNSVIESNRMASFPCDHRLASFPCDHDKSIDMHMSETPSTLIQSSGHLGQPRSMLHSDAFRYQICDQGVCSNDNPDAQVPAYSFTDTIRKQKTGKQHCCNVCNRSFSRNDMLIRHMRLHSRIKPYHCSECGKHFSRRDNLMIHIRLHTGEKPHKCPHCPYVACRKDMLTRHERIHVESSGRSSS